VVEELEELKRWRETVSKKNYKDLLAVELTTTNDNNDFDETSIKNDNSNNTKKTKTKGSWMTRKGG
jgi:hypothetical protein